MKRISISFVNKQVVFLGLVVLLLAAGCSFEKKTGFNRTMQNLTAHYNILYNANELLRQKQETYAGTYIDQYTDILSVYQDTVAHTDAPDKELDAVIFKANTIINEKEQSKYIGNAYLVLGKANFLGGKYFNAVEFFSYVIRSFPKDKSLVPEAAAWKTRALLYLNNKTEAKLTLDSAFLLADSIKKHLPATIYAAALQYDINTKNYVDGEAAAKKAIAYSNNNINEKLRWTFILGQLQELNHETNDALASYTRIVKSNASFEMAFNANLNRIRINDMRNGIKVNRINLLLSLLKDDNNSDFNDQIYYQVAEIYAANKDIDNALKYYKLSARSSLKNQNQKGLSYLRIADIDFSIKADYVYAKKYYDSTLVNLSVNYPGYQTIQKKSNNLQVLVDKLQIIAREDTLQRLAGMDEAARLKAIDAMVTAHTLQQQATTANNIVADANAAYTNKQSTPTGKAATGSSFYFYNATAVSQGYTDFKRRWGNRKLEDNWRRSNKGANSNTSAANPMAAMTNSNDPDALPTDMKKSVADVSAAGYRQALLHDLPLTPVLLYQSNTRIYNAYLDIANFYRDILEDKKEAIANYELLLSRFPDDKNKALIYYSLYRLYTDIDANKSADYKNRLLKEYPETVFAKVIVDPEYSKKLNDKDARFNEVYNKVYDLYSQKKYDQVISSADSLIKIFPDNSKLAQVAYLRAISAGHLEKVEPFRAELQQLVTRYPGDKLVTPLVKQHLAYVDSNAMQLATQQFAIMNSDTTGAYFTPPVEYQKDAVFNRNRQFVAVNDKPVEKPAEKKVEDRVTENKPAENTPVVEKPAERKVISTLFSNRDSTNYYFVVNVSTGTTDLSSSRFGIGQFNRANFRANTIKHQLKYAGPDNQLIYVGRFYSLATAKDYARAIIPLMPQIMKVPADKYSFFIITQENLDKLAAKKILDDYIEYYQQTLLK